MVDRQDIDALLVGSLYGELTPAEEARLAAHLESHPTDRSALEDLKNARTAVRESRIFDVQDEPPQAISALLLQEAHRRAPRVVRDSSGEQKESWFARLARSFFAHPAMAAAAMLVLVIGVAGTMYMKKGGAEFANKEISAPTESAPAPAIAAASGDNAKNDVTGAGAAAAGSGMGYDVQLSDQNAQVAQANEAEGKLGEKAAVDDKAVQGNADHGKAELAKKDSANGDPFAASDRRQAAPAAHATAPSPKKYVELRTPEAMPMDLDSTTTKTPSRAKGAFKGLAQTDGDSSGIGAGGGAAATGSTSTGNTTGFGATSGRAPAADSATIATESPAAPARNAAPGGAPAPTTTAPAPAPPPPPPPAKPVARGNVAASATPAAPPPAQTKVDPQPQTDALLGWARSQLAQAISLAQKDQCSDAAKIALAIHDRAPAFYAQQVADNRELKGCVAYLRNRVEQSEDRAKRAAPAKNNNAVDSAK